MFVPNSHEIESSQLCRRFTFSEIQLATQNLDESLVIGSGGFGKVYKGTITNGSNISTVAIKRLDSTSNQGASEFWAEVNMLSNLRHCHLVSLIGYCNDAEEMILVYEYMSRGTLEDHLHRRPIPLSWVKRLAICIGAARGLDYLHTGTGIKHGVVHRDLKSSNILLHDTWAAKISDFGLSKICPRNQQSTYVNTGVKGTFGYLDPDYFYTGKLTRKSDVYAFGVVMFEALCGKRAVDRSIDEEQWGLAAWAQNSIKEGRLKQIVDHNITSISPKCLKEFAQLAKRCLHKHPKQRPTMAEVVVRLESILALQEKANNALQHIVMKFFARLAPKVIFSSNDKNSGGQNQTSRRFDFETIVVATENFSKENKISQRETDAPLYKRKLQNGQGISVAKIFSHDTYERFVNATPLLVKLDHENLAKLLGYCIEGMCVFLVYDFALQATPDCLVFDPECTLLNWDKRYKIILGVARALLYLHRDAPIRIIHGDVKPEDILLNEYLNPILSGYMNTRYFETYDSTSAPMCRRYVAPEFMFDAIMSAKVDVYSFGMLVLETITMRRMPDYKSMFTLDYVRRNWLEGTVSNVIDPRTDVDSSSVTRVLEIGLLCVQVDPLDRPTMEEIVSMLLDNSSITLPVSKMCAMVTRERSNSSSAAVDDYDTTAVDVFDAPVPDHLIAEVEECITELGPR